MLFETSFSRFSIEYYLSCNRQPRERIKIILQQFIYFFLVQFYSLRAYLAAFCYNTNYCSLEITGPIIEYSFELFFNHSTILLVSEVLILQVLTFSEIYARMKFYGFFSQIFDDLYPIYLSIANISFKQALQFDTAMIDLKYFPAKGNRYKERIWFALIIAEFSSRILFKVCKFVHLYFILKN